MRIMIDTNVLISAVLFPNPLMTKLLDKVALEHTLVLASFIMEELQMLFETKFSGKKILLDRFLSKYSYDFVYTPVDIDPNDYPKIRDKKDLPILASAIIASVDMIITGDKDFFDVDASDFGAEFPTIVTPREFTDGFMS
jgi:putative PIN family toxin of toxin-antitoxin system